MTINGNLLLRKYILFFVWLLLFVLFYAICGLLDLDNYHSKLLSFSNRNTLILKITLLAHLLGNAQLLSLSLIPSPAR